MSYRFPDDASFKAKTNNTFYAGGYLDAVTIKCKKMDKTRMVRNGRNQEVVSMTTYLIPSNITVRPDDMIDGVVVINVSTHSGMSFSYSEVMV